MLNHICIDVICINRNITANIIQFSKQSRNLCIILFQKFVIFLRLAPVQPHDGVQIFELPIAPLVQGSVNYSIIVSGINEKHFILQFLPFSLVKEPQRAWQGFGIEKVITHTDHHIHMTSLNKLLADIAVFARAVRSGRSHDETGTTMLVQVRMEVADPKIVAVTHFLFCVDRRHTEGQAACALGRFGVDLVHIEGRIRHNIVTAAVQIVGIVIEGVGLITGFDDTGKSVDSHIHQAELGVVFHLFLTIEGHGAVCIHACMIDKITGLDKHSAAAAGGVQENAAGGFQHIDDHLDQGLGREEHAIVLGDVLCKLVEEILVDATDDITAHLIQSTVIENAQQLRQQFIGEDGVILGQHAGKLFGLRFHQFHGVVDDLAQTVHYVSALVDKSGRYNTCGKLDQILILRFSGQEQCALGSKVAGLHGQHPATTYRTILQDFRLHHFETAISITQENQAQYGHTVLVRGQLGTGAEQVRRFPKFCLEFSNIDHFSSS